MKTKLWNRIAAVLLVVCLVAALAPAALADSVTMPSNAGSLSITASPSEVVHSTASGDGATYEVVLTATLELDPTVVRLAKENSSSPRWSDLNFTAVLTYPTSLGIVVSEDSIVAQGAGLTSYTTSVSSGTITITGEFDGSKVSTAAMTCTGTATITGRDIIKAVGTSGTYSFDVNGTATVSGIPTKLVSSGALSAKDICTITLRVTSGGGTIPPSPIQPSGPRDPATTGVGRLLNYQDHVSFMNGYPNGTFSPEASIKRSEVAQIFYNLLLNKNITASASFPDVKRGAWYYDAVTALASLGIIKGYPDGTFRPENRISRAEFVTIATRFANAATGTSSFVDVPTTHWAYQNISTAVFYGWVDGRDSSHFAPEENLKRVEAATIVNRMLGRAADTIFVDAHRSELRFFSDVLTSYWGYYQIVEATNAHNHTGINANEKWTGLK